MLDELLHKCDFRSDGVYLDGSGLKVLDVYQFLHEGIADAHIPVYKIVGFNLSSASHMSIGASITERNISVLENTFEIAYNLTDKIFIAPNSGMASVVDYEGDLSLSAVNDIIMSNAHYPSILYSSPHILTSVNPVTLNLKVMCGTGYWDMSKTYQLLNDTSFFPMVVHFSLLDMCRICPPVYEDRVEYRMQHGFEPAMLKYHLTLLQLKAADLDKEDKLWLSKYEH